MLHLLQVDTVLLLSFQCFTCLEGFTCQLSQNSLVIASHAHCCYGVSPVRESRLKRLAVQQKNGAHEAH